MNFGIRLEGVVAITDFLIGKTGPLVHVTTNRQFDRLGRLSLTGKRNSDKCTGSDQYLFHLTLLVLRVNRAFVLKYMPELSGLIKRSK
jgi:hypothetical protein